jgi:hypothetical protein
VAAEVSQTAGTFVCNHVFYALMHALATRRGFKRTRGGFIHVPYVPEQGLPSMPLDEIVRGLRLAVAAALATTQDIAKGAGASASGLTCVPCGRGRLLAQQAPQQKRTEDRIAERKAGEQHGRPGIQRTVVHHPGQQRATAH